MREVESNGCCWRCGTRQGTALHSTAQHSRAQQNRAERSTARHAPCMCSQQPWSHMEGLSGDKLSRMGLSLQGLIPPWGGSELVLQCPVKDGSLQWDQGAFFPPCDSSPVPGTLRSPGPAASTQLNAWDTTWLPEPSPSWCDRGTHLQPKRLRGRHMGANGIRGKSAFFPLTGLWVFIPEAMQCWHCPCPQRAGSWCCSPHPQYHRASSTQLYTVCLLLHCWEFPPLQRPGGSGQVSCICAPHTLRSCIVHHAPGPALQSSTAAFEAQGQAVEGASLISSPTRAHSRALEAPRSAAPVFWGAPIRTPGAIAEPRAPPATCFLPAHEY